MVTTDKNIKVIGGGYARVPSDIYATMTDSGRSSLRLILKSIGKGKKFLLPDFLCDSILKVFKEEKIQFGFYHICEDLSIDEPSLVDLKGYHAFYIIDYFGQRNSFLSRIGRKDLIVVQDGVFLPVLERPKDIKNWVGFNSLRKISCLVDGSLIQSTFKLKENLISKEEARFPRLMREVQSMWDEHIHKGMHSEKGYLEALSRARAVLDRQKKIYSVSKASMMDMVDFYKNIEQERKLRLKNFEVLDGLLKKYSIGLKPEFPSYYVLSVEKREDLQRYLFGKKIFPRVFWPRAKGQKNKLYDKLLSIPVDTRYDRQDMRRVARQIKNFYTHVD